MKLQRIYEIIIADHKFTPAQAKVSSIV